MDSTAVIWIIVAIAVALVSVIVMALVVASRDALSLGARRGERAEDRVAETREPALAAGDIEAQRTRALADAASAASDAERAKARAALAEVDARRYAEQYADEVEQEPPAEAIVSTDPSESDEPPGPRRRGNEPA